MPKHQSELFKVSNYLHPRYYGMWLFILLLRIIALFSYRTQLKIGKGLGRLIERVSKKRQYVTTINLKLCFPELSDAERKKIYRDSFENLGISIAELAMCWFWPARRFKNLAEIRGLEYIEQCQKQKQGIILLTGHFTSLEIGGRLMTLTLPMQAMYRTQKNRLFDSILYTKRLGYLEDMISRKNTRGLIRGIRKGIPTWYAPDQDFRKERNVFAPFFGIPTATLSASARLAKSSGAAMLPYYPERKADGSGYILHILPPLENFPSDDELADATAINASIEQFVRMNPGQYLWAHQRFKTRPADEASFY